MSNFRRSLEMLLINCRVHLELNWIEDFIFSSTGDSAKLEITDAKLHIPIVTLSTKNRVNLKKQLNECFKRSVYWKSYKTKPAKYKKEKTYTNYLMHISRCQKITCSCSFCCLIAADLSKHKALDADPRATQQIVFQVVGGNDGSKKTLYAILEQSKECVEYNKVNVKLSDAQQKKLKTAVKNKTGTTLRMRLKMFDGNDLPYELLLTARQRKKLKNTFNNNISTDLRL